MTILSCVTTEKRTLVDRPARGADTLARKRPVDGWHRCIQPENPGTFERWSTLHGWAIRVLHLCSHSFGARITFGTMHAAPVDWYRFRSALHLSGSMRYPTVTVALVQAAPRAAYWQRQPISRGQVLVLPPGSTFELSAPPGLELVFFYLRGAPVRTALAGRRHADDGESIVVNSLVTPTATQTQVLAAMLEGNLRSPRANARARQALESLAQSAMGVSDEPSTSSVRPRVHHAQTARAHIERHFHTDIKLDDLAVESGISSRMLQICFKEVFGTTPMRFLRARRLHAAYRALRDCGRPGETTVTEVAVQCGFAHLGRFSAYYKAVYGESPNQTLLSGAATSLR